MGFFGSALQSLLGSIGSAIPGLTDAGAALIAFFGTITDGEMWRSLGWLLLGIVLMGVGLALWTKNQAIPGVRSAVGV